MSRPSHEMVRNAVDDGDMSRKEAMEVCRLIAAAPALPEACKGMVSLCQEMDAFTDPSDPDPYAALKAAEAALAAAENPEGLHQRYIVSKADGTPVDPEARYFVLRLDSHGDDPTHITACRAAAMEYIEAVHRDRKTTHLRQMADELWRLVHELRQTPFMADVVACDHCGGYGQVMSGLAWVACPKCGGARTVHRNV